MWRTGLSESCVIAPNRNCGDLLPLRRLGVADWPQRVPSEIVCEGFMWRTGLSESSLIVCDCPESQLRGSSACDFDSFVMSGGSVRTCQTIRRSYESTKRVRAAHEGKVVRREHPWCLRRQGCLRHRARSRDTVTYQTAISLRQTAWSEVCMPQAPHLGTKGGNLRGGKMRWLFPMR